MRIRPFAIGLVVLVGIIGWCNLSLVRAATTIASSFNISAAGNSPVLTLGGQLYCAVDINGPPQSISVTPQFSADGSNWIAATTINNGSITQFGYYIGINGNTIGQQNNYFRFVVLSMTGTQLNGEIVCGDTLPVPGTGAGPIGPSGPPGPAVQVTQSSGITVTEITSSPVPVYQVAARPSGCVGIDGSGNLVYTCPTPYATPTVNATATSCSAPPGSAGLTVMVPWQSPNGCGGSGGATPYPTPTATATATACAAPVAASGLEIFVPICTPLPVPVSVTNGGTGTSSPNPMATATSCGQPVTLSQGFPSLVIQVPVCATGAPQATPEAGTCITISTPPPAGVIAMTCPTPQTVIGISPIIITTPGGIINIACSGGCSGSGIATINGGTCISPSPNATANPITIEYTCATPTAFPTPSPVTTSTAGAPAAIWTTSAGLPQLSIDFPAGGGSGISTINGGPCISPSPSATANPITIDYTCATPTPFPTPSPVTTSTAGAPSAFWTSSPVAPTLVINFPVGGGGSGTSFEQSVKNFCTNNSISGCHYWPMNETTGSTALDAIGSLNGTYTSVLTDLATYLPGLSMGMPDGSVGVDMWSNEGNGNMSVTPLPTPSPAQYTEGVIVRDCDSQGTGAAVSYISSFSSPVPNTGAAIYANQQTLFAQTGNGSSISNTVDNLINQSGYAYTCQPMLLMVMYTNGVSSPSQETVAFSVNGLPNSEAANTTAPPSAFLYINDYYSSSVGFEWGGKGAAYCCAFYIPGSWAPGQLLPLVAAFGR